jgi:hypothetical protein
MRRLGRQRNRQVQVETLVRELLEPEGRRQRYKVLELLGEQIRVSQWPSPILPWKDRGSSVACGVVPADPVFVSWTLHAFDKARQLGFARGDVEAAVLGGHRGRQLNRCCP